MASLIGLDQQDPAPTAQDRYENSASYCPMQQTHGFETNCNTGYPNDQRVLQGFNVNDRPVMRSVYRTTVAFDAPGEHCLVVHGVMLDSGAGANFVHRHVVDALNLPVQTWSPVEFTLADGTVVFRDHMVYVSFRIGGIAATIPAFINEGLDEQLMLLGTPAWEQLGLCMSVVSNAVSRWLQVTAEVGLADIRNFVPRDSPGQQQDMHVALKTDRCAVRARIGDMVLAGVPQTDRRFVQPNAPAQRFRYG